MFFVPLWITFDATSFPSSQTGGFSSFHPQSRLSLVGVNQNYFSWSASTVPTPSSVYSSAGIELTASCFSGGIELYHSSHSRVSSDNHIIPLPYISLPCIFYIGMLILLLYYPAHSLGVTVSIKKEASSLFTHC